MEMMQIDEAGASQEEPQETPDEVERRGRAADMERLKMKDLGRRREVALMDMMGEYGSKVRVSDKTVWSARS